MRFISKISHGKFEAISFITGFSLMAFELVAARLLAPTVGSSTYVWTGVIGVIIAALSIGYWLGGKLADRRNQPIDVVALLLLTAFLIALTRLFSDSWLAGLASLGWDVRFEAVVASLLLFAPASVTLGMISPYLVKLQVRSLATSGSSVARLSATNAIGSIIGTFTTGFILFGFVGARETLIWLVLLLILTSWLVLPLVMVAKRLAASLLIATVAFTPVQSWLPGIAIDTPSAHYTVAKFERDTRVFTGLLTGPSGIQSGVYDDDPSELVFWYNQQMAKIALEKQPESILVLGGGAFTLPQYLANQLPNSQIDVVEIDPGLEAISKQYFHYQSPANIKLHFGDARQFLGQTNNTYDLVLVDVYGDDSIPFSLMTKQYGQALARTVKDDGLVVANIIGGHKFEACRQVLGALDAVYRQNFPQAVYATESGLDEARANYVIAYAKTAPEVAGMKPFLELETELYSDNFAPAERLYFGCRAAQ